MAQIHLVLGGARSGKSSFAEAAAKRLAENNDKPLIYIATAQSNDDEMDARIARHQTDRGDDWQTLECPLSLVDALREWQSQEVVILVDCLTLWLSNHLCQSGTTQWQQSKAELLQLLATWSNAQADLLLVSNEVGHGIVPLGELSRQFVDESGWLHQDLAKVADKVDFVVAGLPLNLKHTGT